MNLKVMSLVWISGLMTSWDYITLALILQLPLIVSAFSCDWLKSFPIIAVFNRDENQHVGLPRRTINLAVD
ncbi:hypothetical protein QBC35DRAFT_278695 [Podospora australis]|uniref:Uncharacterized protein n=1 Tax=Podospora australis TaxID=1536484 RepID=A0AAN6X244_9PEZI|nr:hypothetical protein QBC35DRAFT_278695 [Podospora australis]